MCNCVGLPFQAILQHTSQPSKHASQHQPAVHSLGKTNATPLQQCSEYPAFRSYFRHASHHSHETWDF